jgi:hypothetical protein
VKEREREKKVIITHYEKNIDAERVLKQVVSFLSTQLEKKA